MPDEPRLLELLAELLEGATPEEVCRSCPELIPQVRARYLEVCRAQVELDAMFPPFRSGGRCPPSSARMTLPTIDGYEVEEVVGRGGMGVVFRARHLGLNRLVALKMLLAGEYAGHNERERFRREAESVAGLRHPNVVQIYDVGISDGRPFFTMEYVEGGSLAQRLNGAPQPPRDAAQLLAILAAAVHTAHQNGIIHRDLKPANVLLTADGTPKVSDFGLACRLDDEAPLTRTGAALGTPGYMAPEQVSGRPASVAVDVYALGTVLYELLTGRPPFRGGTVAETVQQVTSLDPVPPSRRNTKVPRDLEVICLKCLRKEPALRYPDASALNDDLDRFLQGEAIAARPEGRLERVVRRVRRRPVLAAAAVFCTAITAVGAGAWVWVATERAAADRRVAADRAAADRAADAHLRQMAEAMRVGEWAEARVALERAKAWLGSRGPEELPASAVRGEQDLALAARLDAIRLTAYSRVGVLLDFTRTDEEYEVAFRAAGLGGPGDPPAEVAVRVKESLVRNAVLSALDHWSVMTRDPRRRGWVEEVTAEADGDATNWRARARAPAIWKDKAALFDLIAAAPEQGVTLLLAIELVATPDPDTRLAFLGRVLEYHPRDFWANVRLAVVLTGTGRSAEAIGYYQAAAALRPGVAFVHHNLASLLLRAKRVTEAVAQSREAARLDPTNGLARCEYAHALLVSGRHAEAVDEARAAVRLSPDNALLHTILAEGLKGTDRPADAVAAFRRAVALDPKLRDAQRGLRSILRQLGNTGEVLDAWAGALAADPADHDEWYGYAELCLFDGREEAYLAARRSMLAKFDTATNLQVMERTARACLLRPASGDDLARTSALAARVAAISRESSGRIYHAFRFVKGLADYRQGLYGPAITTMEGDAAPALGPAPRLVVAMAQHRSGRVAEARKTLAAAVSIYDWAPVQIRDQDGWIIHVLRREAEGLILPDLRAFLAGEYQPRDNDERLILLGACQSTGRVLAAARLYSAALAADPALAGDAGRGHRLAAARYAVLAGCGKGADGPALNEVERATWRAQARGWLRADLTAWGKALDDERTAADDVRQRLSRWRVEPDLAGLREQAALALLPAGERTDCLELWAEVEALLSRCGGGK